MAEKEEQEQEIFERAQSIVKKALSSIGQDNSITSKSNISTQIPADVETTDSDTADIVTLNEIKFETCDASVLLLNHNDIIEKAENDAERAIADAAITLTQAVITNSHADVTETITKSQAAATDPTELSRPLSGRCYSAQSTQSHHRIPIANEDEEDLADEELGIELENKEELEEREESREDFVIRRTFESYTEYTRSLHQKDRLTEKRYLQLLRETGLIGPGTTINTTDAEMVFFKYTADRRQGMSIEEFRHCFLYMLSISGNNLEDITEGECEEVRSPEVPVHYYPAVIMSVK